MLTLTDEQIQIIDHPTGHHGKVLSVAGSGKTTTMAHRVKHLLEHQLASQHQIQVLMFNRDARRQFQARLQEIGVPRQNQPHVDTFHSYAFRIIHEQGNHEQWYGAGEEFGHIKLLQAITSVARQLKIDEDDLDPGDVHRAIDLWKGALIPHHQAGYIGPMGDAYAATYRDFEAVRHQSNALTFADFVPEAIQILQTDEEQADRLIAPLRHIIVDEYQDVNLGQQKLIEVLASDNADVLAVGDDDQTIYEWRGARSEYILREFETTFTGKPHATYHLTHSFRFGYAIAQTSYNVITHNSNRNPKSLISHDPAADCHVQVLTDQAEAGGSANEAMVNEIVRLVKEQSIHPDSIRTLGRTYSQLNGFTMELLRQSVPFYIAGNEPFFLSGPCQALLNYIRVADRLDEIPDQDLTERFVNIANKPSRYLNRQEIQRHLQESRRNGITMRQALLLASVNTDYNLRQQDNLADLVGLIESLEEQLHREQPATTSNLLQWIDQHAGLTQHYQDYYGKGEYSLDRIAALEDLKLLAQLHLLPWREFLAFIESCDTKRGLPTEECIQLTTIHRAKGLEFDYVFIPDCSEGHMPVITDNVDPTFNITQPWRRPRPAEWLENERRLFYVAAIRARVALYIGAPSGNSPDRSAPDQDRLPSRFIEEMELLQTDAVATELVKAVQGAETLLDQVCQQFHTFHKIIRPIKDEYSRLMPDPLRKLLADITLSDAERPFLYSRRYESPGANQPKAQPMMPSLWDHIKLQRPGADNDAPQPQPVGPAA